jgi:AcrR family transcriptional regulator
MATSRSTIPKPKEGYHHGDLPAALLAQAVKLIRKRGDLNFSLRDLAAQVGVSHAAVYRHFNSKGALLAAVALSGFALLEQALRDAAKGLDDQPGQQLVQLGAAYVGLALGHPGHFAAMFAPELHASDQAAQVLAAAEQAYQVMVQTVMRRMGAADAQAPGVQAESLRCWALVHGLASLQLSGNLSACLGRDVGRYSAVQLQGFMAEVLGGRELFR